MHLLSLDSRCRAIVEYLLNNNGYVKVDEISKSMNISKRSVYYDISKINGWLTQNRICEIQSDRLRGVYIDSVTGERIRQQFENAAPNPSHYYVYSPKERLAIIVCAIIGSHRPIFMETLAEICFVSRNTILNDLKELKSELVKYNLRVVHHIKRGYAVSGGVIKKRAVFLYYLSSIVHLFKQQLISFVDYGNIERNVQTLSRLEAELATEYVDGTLFQLAVLIYVAKKKKETVEIDITEEQELISTKEYRLVQLYFPELNRMEHLYFAIHLLGARVQVTRPAVPKNIGDIDLFKVVADMIQEFEQLACIEFNESDQLAGKLFQHMSSSLYRYRYGIIEGNPLSREIEINYPELFHITGKVCESLSKMLGYPITNCEVAYLTLHFGGHLRSKGNKKGVVRVLLVCPNGISTSHLLKNELEELSPYIEVINTVSLKELDGYRGLYDFIVSTVEIKHKRRVILVNSVLSKADKQTIMSNIFKVKGTISKKDDAEKIYGKIKNYVSENHRRQVFELLKEHFNRDRPVKQDSDEEDLPAISQLLTVDHLQISQGEKSWEQSIITASAPLYEKGLIRWSYIQSMIGNVQTFGPYMFLSPEIALVHAKPCDGVEDLSISLLLLKNGVEFPDRHVAKIVIVLAPVDNERHLRFLKEIVDFFSDPGSTVRLLESRDVNEAHHLLVSGSP